MGLDPVSVLGHAFTHIASYLLKIRLSLIIRLCLIIFKELRIFLEGRPSLLGLWGSSPQQLTSGLMETVLSQRSAAHKSSSLQKGLSGVKTLGQMLIGLFLEASPAPNKPPSKREREMKPHARLKKKLMLKASSGMKADLFLSSLAQFAEEANTLARMTDAERALTLPVGHPLRTAFLSEMSAPKLPGDDSGASV